MRGRLEPMDTDRDDRHVAEDEDRQEFQRMVAERRAFQSELDHVPPAEAGELPDHGGGWLAGEDHELGMTRADWDEIRGRR